MNKKDIALLISMALFSGVSSATDKEMCFKSVSNITGSVTILNLTYGEVRNGHVNIFGKGCYSQGLMSDCAPVLGSGILHDNELEGNLQSVEFENYGGREQLAENTIHLTLNLDTLEGYYAASASVFIAGQESPIEIFDKGTATAFSCPKVTKEEKALDLKFKRAINKIDKQK